MAITDKKLEAAVVAADLDPRDYLCNLDAKQGLRELGMPYPDGGAAPVPGFADTPPSPTQERLDKDYYHITEIHPSASEDEPTESVTHYCNDDLKLLRELGEWARNELPSASEVRAAVNKALARMRDRHSAFTRELAEAGIGATLAPPPPLESMLMNLLEDAQYAGLWQELRAEMAEITKHATDGRKPLPDFKSALLLDVAHGGSAGPPELIEGLIHRGEKMIFSGASKTGKSWAVLDLALSIASGEPFWDMPTQQAPVLVVNFEIDEYFMNDRLRDVGLAKGLYDPKHQSWLNGVGMSMQTWNLRGHYVDFERVVAELKGRIAEYGPFGAIVFDPLYSALGGRNENDAGEVAELMKMMGDVAAEADCAVVMIHHFAKGPSGMKSSIDRGSGSGVFARDPDAIVTLDKHNDDELGRWPSSHCGISRRSRKSVYGSSIRYSCPMAI